MYQQRLKAFLLAGLFIPNLALATVTEKDFEVKTTRDLVDLCSASTSDNYYKEAIHFCYGYLIGAYQYHMAAEQGPDGKPLVCFPKSGLTRDDVVKEVVSWMQKHPKYMQDTPVETEFRALIEKWPCK